MNNVYLVKDGDKIRHFYSEAEMKSAGFSKATKIVTEELYNSNGCYARIIDGDIIVGRTKEEVTKEETANEISELIAEVAERDYRALKAVKLAKVQGKPAEDLLEELYPGEAAWYAQKLNRIHELQEILGIK